MMLETRPIQHCEIKGITDPAIRDSLSAVLTGKRPHHKTSHCEYSPSPPMIGTFTFFRTNRSGASLDFLLV